MPGGHRHAHGRYTVRKMRRRSPLACLAVLSIVLATTGTITAQSALRVPSILSSAGGGDFRPAQRVAPADPGPGDQPDDASRISDGFDGTGPLLNYTTTKPDVLPVVGRVDGRYRAELTDNTGNRTLHFNESQGRLDAKVVTFPFDYVARNIGIGSLTDSQVAPNPSGSIYLFAGIQVHSTDLVAADSAHVVVGHRGNTKFTIEGKNTVNGNSRVNDIGANTAPSGRADIRIVGNTDRTLTVYWQTSRTGSAADSWQLYRGTGSLPGPTAAFGPTVYIGLITYAFGSAGLPFVGTADSVQLVGE